MRRGAGAAGGGAGKAGIRISPSAIPWRPDLGGPHHRHQGPGGKGSRSGGRREETDGQRATLPAGRPRRGDGLLRRKRRLLLLRQATGDHRDRGWWRRVDGYLLRDPWREARPVSYTHLTLPTIYSV